MGVVIKGWEKSILYKLPIFHAIKDFVCKLFEMTNSFLLFDLRDYYADQIDAQICRRGEKIQSTLLLTAPHTTWKVKSKSR